MRKARLEFPRRSFVRIFALPNGNHESSRLRATSLSSLHFTASTFYFCFLATLYFPFVGSLAPRAALRPAFFSVRACLTGSIAQQPSPSTSITTSSQRPSCMACICINHEKVSTAPAAATVSRRLLPSRRGVSFLSACKSCTLRTPIIPCLRTSFSYCQLRLNHYFLPRSILTPVAQIFGKRA